MPDAEPTRGAAETKPKRRPRPGSKSHIIVMLSSLAAGFAGAVTVLDSWQKVAIELGLRKDETFVLAEQNAKGDLVRQLVHLVSRRDFWIVRYAGAVSQNFPASDQADAWKSYNESVVTWNEDYMTNYLLVTKYFDQNSSKALADINWQLRGLNTCLNKVHYRDLFERMDPICHLNGIDGGDQKQNLDAVTKTTAQLDKQIETFVLGLSR